MAGERKKLAIIDSDLKLDRAIGSIGPKNIREAQRLLDIYYIGFDSKEHRGQLVIHEDLVNDVLSWFALAHKLKFPIEKVVPATIYKGDDKQLMALNICSGFNYRKIAGTNKLSPHALGRAFDVNQKQNPYIHKRGSKVVTDPKGAIRDVDAPGTLQSDHELVNFLTHRGWEWGGIWSLEKTGRIDYHHFQKL